MTTTTMPVASPAAEYEWLESPLGRILLTSDGRGITDLEFVGERDANRVAGIPRRGGPLLTEAVRQLRAYFTGTLRRFDLPLAPRGTEFQRRVWRALLDIPHGELASYGEIARRVGNPAAQRAVGSANHENPIAIVVPCHRVVGKDGRLVGYGGGLDRKAWLIAHERGDGAQLPLFS